MSLFTSTNSLYNQAMAELPPAPSLLKHLPVLDAPSPWIAQFLNSADRATRSSLFKSCKALRDMVIGVSNKVQLNHHLSLDPTGTATMASLQLLTGCKHGAMLKLAYSSFGDEAEIKQAAVHAALWLSNLCASMTLLPSLPLHRITYLNLKGIVTDELVPPSVNAACPNLQHIKHDDYRPWLRATRIGAPPMPCLQVQRLSLMCWRVPPDNQAVQLFEKQLQSLPNLQDLTLKSYNGEDNYLQRGILGLTQHLTRLKLKGTIQLPSACPETESFWPQLQCLKLPYAEVSSEYLEKLSTITPQLKSLAVYSMHTTTSCTCAGNRFTMLFPNLRHVHVYKLNIEDLAIAPMKGLVRFEFSLIQVRECDLPLLPKALANLPLCLYVGAFKDCLGVGFDEELVDNQAQLPDVIPLLKCLRFQKLTLPYEYMLDEGNVALFLQLPQMRVLNIRRVADEDWFLARITTMCVQARWPATLVCDWWGKGWQQQLVAAMQAAGHQHISFELDYDI